MSKVTTLAEGQLTAVGTITIELVEADETPAVVIVQWPPQRVASETLSRHGRHGREIVR